IRPGAEAGEAAGAIAPGDLPQIVNPGRTDLSRDGEAGAEPEAPRPSEDLSEAPEAAAPPPALEAFAMPFDASEARALMAVILIDEPDPRLDLETLTSIDFPVAFAIDPARPDAADRAAAYRAAGFEVLMLGSVIPEGATAADTEVALAAARRRVPEAIALMDTPDSRIQTDRTVLEAAVGIAAGEGQGLVAFPRGLNVAEHMAARADVPAATLFRLLDDEGQRATVIARFLSRAEFAAAQEGAVIVAGRTRPATVTALFSWALAERDAGVVIAPVSAVLQRLSGAE
ncbi:MAG: divergent polysaccharide deacetylase family protein, partial [Roseicyclus sp.]